MWCCLRWVSCNRWMFLLYVGCVSGLRMLSLFSILVIRFCWCRIVVVLSCFIRWCCVCGWIVL